VDDSDGIYSIKPSSLAEDDGRSWSWKGPCPTCGRSSSSQVDDLNATLVSEPAPVVGLDSGPLLIRLDALAIAKSRGLAVHYRPASLRDGDGSPTAPFIQLTADRVLAVRSATHEPCGCVAKIDWNPLAVEAPASRVDAYFIDANPSRILVSHRLASFLQEIDPHVKSVPVRLVR
jgi:hypothetical protein